jgi:hypothetical protein
VSTCAALLGHALQVFIFHCWGGSLGSAFRGAADGNFDEHVNKATVGMALLRAGSVARANLRAAPRRFAAPRAAMPSQVPCYAMLCYAMLCYAMLCHRYALLVPSSAPDGLWFTT